MPQELLFVPVLSTDLQMINNQVHIASKWNNQNLNSF